MFFEDRTFFSTLSAKRNLRFIYPAHFHLELEIFMLRRGTFTLTVNGERIVMQPGDITVIDSYDVHSYDSELIDGERDCGVLIIPFEQLTAFNSYRNNLRLKEHFIRDSALCNKLLALMDEYLCVKTSEQTQLAAIELFLALLSEKLQFAPYSKGSEEVLVRAILTFIQQHFKEKIPLSLIAQDLGYSEEHLSRSFHKYVKMGLPEYVNRLRLDFVAREKSRNPKRKMIDLIYEAGFQSQQSFYRAKNAREKSVLAFRKLIDVDNQ